MSDSLSGPWKLQIMRNGTWYDVPLVATYDNTNTSFVENYTSKKTTTSVSTTASDVGTTTTPTPTGTIVKTVTYDESTKEYTTVITEYRNANVS
jgi:hypothetical protein